MTDNELVTVVLSCLHTLSFGKLHRPRIGESMWCRRCESYKQSIVPPDSFRVACRDCTKGPTRDYGSASLRAHVDADKHARKSLGHRVRVLNGERIVYEVMHHAPPSLLDDVPPF